MATIENLKPIQKGQLSNEELKQRGSNGGIKSGEVRREKKLFKEAIEKKLGASLDEIIDSLIDKAKTGDVNSSVFLRDTIGEKPTDKVEGSLNVSYEDNLKEMTDNDEY